MKKIKIKFVLAFTVMFLQLNLWSYDFNSSVNASVGGGGRAAVEPYGAALSNPALLSRLDNRHLTSSFIKDQVVVSFIDSSKENLFAGGFTYKEVRGVEPLELTQSNNNKLISDEDILLSEKYKLQRLSLSLSDQFIESVSFGLNINMLNLLTNQRPKQEKLTAYNLDVGFVWTPFLQARDFNLAMTFTNFANQGESLSTEKTIFAASYVYSNFVRFRYDLEAAEKFDFKKPSHVFGFESFLNDWVVWRLGYKIGAEQSRLVAGEKRKESNQYSGGIGFVGPKLGLHYAYVQETELKKETRHSVDLGYSF